MGEQGGQNPIAAGLSRVGETFRELRRYRNAFLMLLAFMIYNDGIQTIIRLATVYGAEIGISRDSLIAAILLVQFAGIPFTFLFGFMADRLGTVRSLYVALAVYTFICVLAYQMTTAAEFFVLAVAVAMVQGGSQALSRSLFASLIPRQSASQFFGFFSVFEKFAGIFGPAIFAIVASIHRIRPRRHPVGHRVLCRRRRAACARQRVRGAAHGTSGRTVSCARLSARACSSALRRISPSSNATISVPDAPRSHGVW